MGCDYCNGNVALLSSEVMMFNDIVLYGMGDMEYVYACEIRKALEEIKISVFLDRGYLRLTEGNDTSCVDHSLEYKKANFCMNCGRGLWE